MQIIRLVAVYRDGLNQNSDYKFIIICGLDEARNMVTNCEWFGYYEENEIIYPFVLQGGNTLRYGYEDNVNESTNIGMKTINTDELFTVFGSDNSEAIYQITSCFFMNCHKSEVSNSETQPA